MNTTKKGDELEQRAFRLLNELLEKDEFYVPGKRSKVFQKKKYYSSRRNSDIIFDLAIETTLPNASSYSLLTLVECKNYNKPIPVDDIEEFESKIRQIGEHNTKGLFITNAPFQKAALDLAKSLKIGVIRLSSNNEYSWVNYRIDRKGTTELDTEAEYNLTNYTETSPPILSWLNNKRYDSFIDICIDLQIIDFYSHNLKYETIPFVTEKYMDSIVTRFYNQDIRNGNLLSVEKATSFLSSVYSIKFDFDADLGAGILGKIEFEPLKICISKSLRNDIARWRFTFAHEISHLFLHRKILGKGFREQTDNLETIQFGYDGSNRNKKRIELQANILASRLLLPTEPFLKSVYRLFREYRIHRQVLYLDHQPINIRESYEIFNLLSEEFGTSIEVIKIRMTNMGLLNDKTDGSIRGLLKSFMKRL